MKTNYTTYTEAYEEAEEWVDDMCFGMQDKSDVHREALAIMKERNKTQYTEKTEEQKQQEKLAWIQQQEDNKKKAAKYDLSMFDEVKNEGNKIKITYKKKKYWITKDKIRNVMRYKFNRANKTFSEIYFQKNSIEVPSVIENVANFFVLQEAI